MSTHSVHYLAEVGRFAYLQVWNANEKGLYDATAEIDMLN